MNQSAQVPSEVPAKAQTAHSPLREQMRTLKAMDWAMVLRNRKGNLGGMNVCVTIF